MRLYAVATDEFGVCFGADIDLTPPKLPLCCHFYSRDEILSGSDTERRLIDFLQQLPHPIFDVSLELHEISEDVLQFSQRHFRNISLEATQFMMWGTQSALPEYRLPPLYTPLEQPKFDQNLFKLDSLRADEAEIVNGGWKIGTEKTLNIYRHMIEHGVTSCVRLRETGELLAWVLMFPDGGGHRGQCVPKYRRHGLAAAVVSDLGDRILAQCPGVQPFGTIDIDNDVSLAMGKKLGWRPIGQVYWAETRERPLVASKF